MRSHPLWFGPPERPLFGWLHLPDGAAARGGVVLVQPFGDARLSTHWTYRRLAEGLAERGIAVLRFDLDGTGDSAGSVGDPGRVAAWRASVHAAVEEIRSAGVTSVALVGMRFAATLAAVVAAERGDIDHLVLWDPCVSGRSFLREQTALSQLALGPSSAEPGDVELPGFVLPAAEVSEVRAVDLGAVAQELPARMLMLIRSDRPATAAFRGRFAEGVEWLDVEDQGALLDVPTNLAAPPEATLARILDWLEAAAPGPEGPLRAPSSARASAVVADGVVEDARELVPGRVFAMISSPVECTGAGEGSPPLTVILFNTANEPHLGPSRLWPELARTWTRLGARCVRMDLGAMGDSPHIPGVDPHETYSVQALPDALAAAEAALNDPLDRGELSSTPGQLVMLGLCSGGVIALEAAILLGARAALTINYVPWELLPGSLGVTGPFTPASPEVVGPPPPPGLAQRVKAAIPPAGWRLLDAVGLRSPHADRLRLAVEQGVELLAVFGDEDVVPFVTSARGEVARLTRRGGLTLVHKPELDHAAKRAGARRALVEVLSRRIGGYLAVDTL